MVILLWRGNFLTR